MLICMVTIVNNALVPYRYSVSIAPVSTREGLSDQISYQDILSLYLKKLL